MIAVFLLALLMFPLLGVCFLYINLLQAYNNLRAFKAPNLREDVFKDPAAAVKKFFGGKAVFVRFEDIELPDGFRDTVVVFDGGSYTAFMASRVIFVSKSFWDNLSLLERKVVLLHERYHVLQIRDKRIYPLYLFLAVFQLYVILSLLLAGRFIEIVVVTPVLIGFLSIALRWPLEFFAIYYAAKVLGTEEYAKAATMLNSNKGAWTKRQPLEMLTGFFIHPPTVFYMAFAFILNKLSKRKA